MKKCLLTGANGQLGKTFQAISEHSNDIVFDFQSSQKLDITNYALIEDLLSKHNYNYVINCAAYTNVESAEDNNDFAVKINADAVKNLAQICQNTNTTLIHISTDYVFDGNSEIPYLETDITNPINSYGKSKLLGEQHIQEHLKQHFIIRTSWLYSVYNKNFVNTMLALSENQSRIKVVNDQFGCPTSTNTITESILRIISSESKEYGVYHCVNKGKTSWYEFAKEIMKISQKSTQILPVTSSEFKTKSVRPTFSVLNCNKLESNFKIELKTWQLALKNALKQG